MLNHLKCRNYQNRWLTTRYKRLLFQILAIGTFYCLVRLISHRYHARLLQTTSEERREIIHTNNSDRANASSILENVDAALHHNPAATSTPPVEAQGAAPQSKHVDKPSTNEGAGLVSNPGVRDVFGVSPAKVVRGVDNQLGNLAQVDTAKDVSGVVQAEGQGREDLSQVRKNDVVIQSRKTNPTSLTSNERGVGYIHENQLWPSNVEMAVVYQGENVGPAARANEEENDVVNQDENSIPVISESDKENKDSFEMGVDNQYDTGSPVQFQNDKKGVVSMLSDKVSPTKSVTQEKEQDDVVDHKPATTSTGEGKDVASVQDENINRIKSVIDEKYLDSIIESVKDGTLAAEEETGGIRIQNNNTNPLKSASKFSWLRYFLELLNRKAHGLNFRKW